MKYDPILCMMVNDSVKTADSKVNDFSTCDAKPVVGKTYLIRGHKIKVLEIKGDYVKTLMDGWSVSGVDISMFKEAKALDSKTIDEAIRSIN